MMSQRNFYPSAAASCFNISSSPMCTRCNVAAPHDPGSGCTSDYQRNTSGRGVSCSAYCNSSCNTICNSSQAYCSIGRQSITSHGDIGSAPQPGGSTATDQLIHKAWTAQYWNSLIDKLNAAEGLGRQSRQGSSGSATKVSADPTNSTHPSNSLITAEKYNQIRQKFAGFSASYPAVNAGDVIKSSHAEAMKTAFQRARFKTSVCDICNAGMQHAGSCGCNCSCSCDCNCGCSCPCDCSCDCSCDCNCGCSCPNPRGY